MFEDSGLLEGLLAQLIKVSIYNQVSSADHLKVEVSTALHQLMQGEASGLSIHSKGVWLSPELKIDALDVQLSRLAISLKDAVQGQLKLEGPLTVSVDIRLRQESLNQFLNTALVSDWLQSIVFLQRQQAFSLSLQGIRCQLQESRLTFDLQAEMQRHFGDTFPIAVAGSLRIAPHTDAYEQKTTLIYLEEARFERERAPLIAETAAILNWVDAVIGRRQIEQDFFLATIRVLKISADALELGLDAHVQQPTALLTHLGL